MPDKLITPTDLRNIARQLLRDGKMPSPQVFAETMAEVREEYVPPLKKLREQKKETSCELLPFTLFFLH